MRRSILLVLVLTAVGLVGCTPDPTGDLPSMPEFTVFLEPDVSAAQRLGVEEKLRTLPDLDVVAFETREQSYAKAKEMLKDQPEAMSGLAVENMPESFHVRMTTLEAYQRVRAGSVEAEIRALPGVADIVFQCASVEECRERAPTPR